MEKGTWEKGKGEKDISWTVTIESALLPSYFISEVFRAADILWFIK